MRKGYYSLATISEDIVKKSQEETQKITDSFILKVDEVLGHKEKEIMEV